MRLYKTLFICILVFINVACESSKEEPVNLQKKAKKIAIIHEKEIPFKIASPNGLAFDDSSIWVAEYVSSKKSYKPSIIQIALPRITIKRKILGIAHMEGLTTDGKNLWVGAPSKKITKIDIQSGSIIREFKSPTRDDADGLAWDGKKLWIASHYHGRRDVQISAVDPNTFQVKNTFSIPVREIGDIAWHQGYLWAAKYGNPKKNDTEALLLKIDIEEEAIVNVYKNEGIPSTIWGITSDQNNIWIMNYNSSDNPDEEIRVFSLENPKSE